MTAVGSISLKRDYVWNATDGGQFRADAMLGIDGFLTRQATRLTVLAGLDQSFARGQQILREMCGWQVDDEVIRQTTHAQGKRVAEQRPTRGDAESFAAAAGEAEVLIDAGKVNTLEGWRDVKIGLFLRREAGSPATPEQWDERELPQPVVRSVVAAIEEAELFGKRLRQESDRLGVTTAAAVTVLGDGAEWIWTQAEEHWPQAAGVLDVFHAIEKIGEAVKGVWGGDPQAAALTDAGRRAVVAEGRRGLDRWFAEVVPRAPKDVSLDPLIGMAAYFAKHPSRLNYAERLASGRSIGSGAVEGTIKQQVNLRLKRTGARWQVKHVGPLVELRAFSCSAQWDSYWTAA